MEYAVEQMDHAGRWVVIKEKDFSWEAEYEMERLHALSSDTAWRVVERPSNRLIVCTGGDTD
jgi:hypothetical protein